MLSCCTMGCQCTHWERTSSARQSQLIWVSPAALNMVALQQSSPSLVRKLECCAAEVQTAIQVSQDYWLEMLVVLAEQHEAQLAQLCVVHSSQCLHHGRQRLAVKGWQPHA